jgi:type I restriction enzyme S subunit
MENVEAHSMRLLGTVPAGMMKSNAVHCQPGDVLYGRLRPYLNKVHVTVSEALCSAEFIVFPGDTPINAAWLAYRLNSSDFVFFASHLHAGDRPRVDFDQIAEFEVLLPPRAEQGRIVAEVEQQLTRLDAAVAALKRVRANLRRYRAAVLKAACEGRLVPTEAELARKEGRGYQTGEQLLARILEERRAKWEADQLARMTASGKPPKDDSWKRKYKEPEPPDTSNLPPLPEGWTWANVGQLAYVGTGATPKRGSPKYYSAGNVPWVTSGAVNNDYVTAATEFVTETALAETNLTVYPKNTLLVAMYGEGKTRGKVSELLIEAATNQAIAALQVVACRAYLKLALKHNYEAIRLGASGGVQPNLNLDLVRQIVVPLPPAPEQDRIMAEAERQLSDTDTVARAVEIQLARADRLRESILKRAFEGKLVLQDPNEEPASALLERIHAERAETRETPSKRPKNRRKRAGAAANA